MSSSGRPIGKLPPANDGPIKLTSSSTTASQNARHPFKSPKVDSGATFAEDPPEQDAQHDSDSQFGGWHYLPLIFAIVPPLGAVIHGRAEAWTDVLLLAIIAFYLYQIVRGKPNRVFTLSRWMKQPVAPWEIYYSSRQRRLSPGLSQQSDRNSQDDRARRQAATELRQTEMISLALTVLSPFGGAYLLYFARTALSEPDRYINDFSIRLFVLASGVKPWNHLFKLIKQRSLFLQEEAHYPISDVEMLRQKLSRLEKEILQIRHAVATKADVRLLRDGIDEPLTHLSQAVRRYERKEHYMQLSIDERFALIDAKLDETFRDITNQADVLDSLRSRYDGRNTVSLLFRIFGYISGSPPSLTVYSHSQALKWYERGPFFYMFLPINIANHALSYAGESAGRLSKKVESSKATALISAEATEEM